MDPEVHYIVHYFLLLFLILILQTKSFFKLTTFPGIDDSTFDDIADSSNNSSLLLADDVQLQADESDESL